MLVRNRWFKRELWLLIIRILEWFASCGGGGGSATVSEPPVSQSPNLLKTLVIDGYVEGANVFVDFNFNLIQDEGEPSGVFNSTTYEYEFTESDFGAITNFTETCGLNRPRVAQAPVGAIDSTRGVVNTYYGALANQ